MNRPPLVPSGPWTLIAGGATIVALLLVGQVYIWVNWWPVKIGWLTAAYWSLPQLTVWALLAPGALWASRRYPIEGNFAPRRLLFHALASVALAVLGLVVLDLTDRVVHWSAWMAAPSSLIARIKYTVIQLHLGIGVYWVILGVDHSLRWSARSDESRRRAGELEALLSQAQLAALRMQLQPHFLFNTMNTIAVLMRRDVITAERMLHRLGDLLRVTLDRSGTQEVPLQEELHYLRSYLEIETARFPGRLSVAFEVEPGTLEARVPNLILQPLVENAVRHGVAPRGEPGRIVIRARRHGGTLELTVLDDGPGLSNQSERGVKEGIGLANTRNRLETLFRGRHRFELEHGPHGGVVARIVIPLDLPHGGGGTEEPAA